MARTMSPAEHAPLWSRPVQIDTGDGTVAGDLTMPIGAGGLVIFAHGSGSGRRSPRNRAVAEAMVRAGFATLLADLLTDAEERLDTVTAELRFDIPFLAGRVVGSIDWATAEPAIHTLPVGLFGASTGAAAALTAAAERPEVVRAVVSRGGRPDLAGSALERVTAPTLLVVGGRDTQVIALNGEAFDRLGSVRRLEIVPGATHLFEEPGALDAVARLAVEWFAKHLTPPEGRPAASL